MAQDRPLAEAVEAADNPEPRCPCVLLLDTSGSMAGERLAALTEGLFAFRATLAGDLLASRRIEIAVVTFNSRVHVAQPFISPDRFYPPALTAGGETHMAEGIEQALTLVKSRKAFYKRHDLLYYRPWVFMITDGKPEGESEEAIANATLRVRAYERSRRVAFFAVGVGDADMDALARIVVRRPLPLRGLDFNELFLWLSASMHSVSRSQPGDKVELAPMTWVQYAADFVRRHKETIELARFFTKITLGV